MNVIQLELSALEVSEDLSRSGSAKQFEERLKSSIEEIGLAEPIKVALLPTGKYVVIDGTMRLKAIAAIRKKNPSAFSTIPAYVMEYDRRYELRYQTDIYQDLLPSQLAELVEHLHQTEHIQKADIARYIGVSPATLRNYTGLWRLLQRGGLFADVVELMDVGIVPSSNPYAWLRLTAKGLRYVLENDFTGGERAESWIEQRVVDARRGKAIRFTIKFVETVTDGLSAEYYRQDEELRTAKRDLGLRRAGLPQQAQLELVQPGEAQQLQLMQPKSVRPEIVSRSEPDPVQSEADTADANNAIKHLSRVWHHSPDPVLRSAAYSLQVYLQ